jgi:hypothetical protein
MLFTATITLPPNRAKADAIVEPLMIARGIITKIMVRPRKGHFSLAHLVIFHGSHQIAPSTEDMDLHGDEAPIDWEEYYEFYQPPYELILKGWNEDTDFPHTFDVYVAILPRKAIMALAVVDALKGAFSILSPSKIIAGIRGKEIKV